MLTGGDARRNSDRVFREARVVTFVLNTVILSELSRRQVLVFGI